METTGQDEQTNKDATPTREGWGSLKPMRLALGIKSNQSEKLDKFLPSFRKAQAAIEEAEKTRRNEHFSASYATLASVLDACKKALNDNGISIVQQIIPASKDGAVAIETRLIHDSEQFIGCSAEAETGRPGPQALGSVISYMRRYTLATLACVVQEDDDGNAAGNGGDDELRPGKTEIRGNNRPAAKQDL